jgi:hypothetical protein
MKIAEIFMPLEGEGTETFRPVLAEGIKENLFRICEQDYDFLDEQWKYIPGTVVEVENKLLNGLEKLVAKRAIYFSEQPASKINNKMLIDINTLSLALNNMLKWYKDTTKSDYLNLNTLYVWDIDNEDMFNTGILPKNFTVSDLNISIQYCKEMANNVYTAPYDLVHLSRILKVLASTL